MDRKEQKMPKGITALYFIKASSTFSYAVFYSSLSLYLTKELNFENFSSNNIVGLFLTFNYLLQLAGGILGGTFLSNRCLFFITTVVQGIGLFLLALNQNSLFYPSLSLFLVGCSLNTTSYYNILTQRFEANDNRREKAFFINYAAMNFGFFVGNVLSGFFDYSNRYEPLFYLSAFTTFLSSCLLVFNWGSFIDKKTSLLKQNPSKNLIKNAQGILFIIFLIPTVVFCFNSVNFSNHLIMGVSLLMLLVMLYLRKKQNDLIDKQRLTAYIILALTSIIFWMIYYTGPMGIMLFTKNNVDKHLFNIEIATQWILNINTIIVILGAPFLSLLTEKLRKNGFNFSVSRQFLCAFIFLSLSFLSLSCGIFFASQDGYSSISWLIGYYILLSIAELLIAPVGYAMIGRIAPSGLQGLLMGTWTMTSGIAANLSHYFSNAMAKTSATDPILTNGDYLYVFRELGIWALLGAFFLYCMANKITKLMENTSENELKMNSSTP